MTCMVSSRPKWGTRPFFNFFRCSIAFYQAISVFLAINASLRYVGVILLAACTTGFLASYYWSAGFGTFLPVSALASIGWRQCC
jgi:hypothetical protein